MRNWSRHFWPRFESSSSVRPMYSATPSHCKNCRPPEELNSERSTVSGSESPYSTAFNPSSEKLDTGSSSVKS